MPINTRRVIWQAGALIIVAALIASAVHNAILNQQNRQISLDFEFLHSTAGFDIPFAVIGWEPTDTFGRAIVVGITNSAVLFFLSITSATLLGFIIGLLRLSTNALVRGTAALYVEVVRSIPALIQVILIYLALLQNAPPFQQSVALGSSIFINNRGLFLPQVEVSRGGTVLAALGVTFFAALVGYFAAPVRAPRIARLHTGLVIVTSIGFLIACHEFVQFVPPEKTRFGFKSALVIPPELVAVVLALTIYFSGFIAEIIRAGFLAVPKGTLEAAEALALRSYQVTALVRLPLALRLIIPPLTNQYLNIAKATSLAVAVAFPDVVQILIGSILNRTGLAIELMGLTMAIFLAVSLGLSAFMNWYNRIIQPARR